MSFTPCTKAACVVLLGCVLLSSPTTGWAQGLGKLKAKAPPKEVQIPENLAPEQVDSYLAGLTDEQARRLFAAELKKKAAVKSGKETKEQLLGRERGLVLGFFAAQRALSSPF